MEYNHSQYVIEAIKQNVIPQVRTYTRYGTGSVVMFDYAESPLETFSVGDSVQTGSQATFLTLFALSYGMTVRGIINVEF